MQNTDRLFSIIRILSILQAVNLSKASQTTVTYCALETCSPDRTAIHQRRMLKLLGSGDTAPIGLCENRLICHTMLSMEM